VQVGKNLFGSELFQNGPVDRWNKALFRHNTRIADSKYLFEGFQKTIYPYFPSIPSPKKIRRNARKRSDSKKMDSPTRCSIPISHRGQTYNPDFIVETEKAKLLRGQRYADLVPAISEDVKEKAHAAIKWAEQASKLEGSKPWSISWSGGCDWNRP